ncbi:hypothetical protein GCM10010347_08010 [Streptomyces cirratus]|uniref:Uncharacterized protein n=1 Tax=Streptomyces cirratus TaxID=68187 RepID=A0ABQ3EMK0_9ACTN|nr:hypothetical protein GCM10010347_08010 [Streptomyces cirratus]
MTVSATECAASDSIALDPLMIPPTTLAAAIPRLVTTATTTVPTLSDSAASVAARGAPDAPGGGEAMRRR